MVFSLFGFTITIILNIYDSKNKNVLNSVISAEEYNFSRSSSFDEFDKSIS